MLSLHVFASVSCCSRRHCKDREVHLILITCHLKILLHVGQSSLLSAHWSPLRWRRFNQQTRAWNCSMRKWGHWWGAGHVTINRAYQIRIKSLFVSSDIISNIRSNQAPVRVKLLLKPQGHVWCICWTWRNEENRRETQGNIIKSEYQQRDNIQSANSLNQTG